jgi:DNA-binding transcriptional regulator GbsR (MarR family)
MKFLDFRSVISDISVMTETTETPKRLPVAVERFVLHWGDLGGRWGVNRSVAQIHALLYVSERPRTAEEIADLLGLARSNVSNSIKELLAWSLIRRVPIKGDRRDHFEAEADVWEMFTRIAVGRKERELDPAIAALRACAAEARGDPTVHAVANARLAALLGFVETLDRWYAQMLGVPKQKLAALIRLGTRIVSFLPGKKA